MRVYWKALVCYGFVFWLLLCITDFLGVTDVKKYSKELDELYEKPGVIQEIERKLEPHLSNLEFNGVKFGWSLVLWNTITFILSVIICSIGRNIAWACWGAYKLYRNKTICSQLCVQNHAPKKVSSSRIPIIKKTYRASDTNLPNLEPTMKIETEKSCPNLFFKRSGSNLSSFTDITTKTCRTIFRKDLYLCDHPGLSNEQLLDKQCKKLKEELHRLQTTSLKEHAILSRKLDSINKEKTESSKQLMVAQKENRAAKQQLEELLEEKSSLLRKLNNASKEFKCNTKTKKFALAKLEEVTNNVDDLRQQLEQVSRDKEILEKKLKLLESEYNKLHERYIASQQKLFATNSNNVNLPERDENNDKDKCSYLERARYVAELEHHHNPSSIQQTAEVLASVSQTELDMKKIQEKIKQLEKSLENLNIQNDGFGCSSSLDRLESDLSLSALDITTDSQHKLEEESGTNYSELSSGNSPRPRQWPQRVAELIGRNQFAQIQALTSKMQEKARFLGNIRERMESTEGLETTDSEDIEPKRLVSSSVAFKNFLKSLNKLDADKREVVPTNREVYI